MGQSTRDSGSTSRSTALACRYGQTGLVMRAFGKIIKPTAKESSGMWTATLSKGSGRMIKQTAGEFICTLTGQCTKVNGRMTSNMDSERRSGQTALATKGTILKGGSMEQAPTFGLTPVLIQGIGMTTK